MGTTRREFVAAGGAGVAATWFLGGTARAQSREWTPAERANVQVVNDFSAAWATGDAAQIASYMAEDCVYRFTRDGEAATGRATLEEQLRSSLGAMGQVEFEILDTFAAGPLVANLRDDHLTSGDGNRRTFRVAGVFYVEDGKIVEWIDALVPTA